MHEGQNKEVGVRYVKLILVICWGFLLISPPAKGEGEARSEYTVGVEDMLQITVLQPERLTVTVNVAPDGTISFPYIGNVYVKGMTLSHIEQEIQERLADGYMKYPAVSVSLRESRSRRFFVYGEAIKPGAYPIAEDFTVLKAISIAGGFTRYGSASRVRLLRPRKDKPGYEMIKVNIKAVMDGKVEEDILLQPGDIIVVSEGMF